MHLLSIVREISSLTIPRSAFPFSRFGPPFHFLVAVGAQVDGSLSSWLAANTNGISLCGSGRW